MKKISVMIAELFEDSGYFKCGEKICGSGSR